MLVKCPECHDKMSSTIRACPHCGYVIPEGARLEPFCQPEPETGFVQNRNAAEPAIEEPVPDKIEERKEPKHPVFHFFKDLILLVLVLLLLAVAVSVILIRSNAFSFRDKLLELCQTDSGSGSHVDTSVNRIIVKYYIVKYVDFVTAFPSSISSLPELKQSLEEQLEGMKEPARKSADKLNHLRQNVAEQLSELQDVITDKLADAKEQYNNGTTREQLEKLRDTAKDQLEKLRTMSGEQLEKVRKMTAEQLERLQENPEEPAPETGNTEAE